MLRFVFRTRRPPLSYSWLSVSKVVRINGVVYIFVCVSVVLDSCGLAHMLITSVMYGPNFNFIIAVLCICHIDILCLLCYHLSRVVRLSRYFRLLKYHKFIKSKIIGLFI